MDGWVKASTVAELWSPPPLEPSPNQIPAREQPPSLPSDDRTDDWGARQPSVNTLAAPKEKKLWQSVQSFAAVAAIAVVGLLAFVLAKPIGQFVGHRTINEYIKGKYEGELAEITEQVASMMRKQLPQKVDEVTTLQNVYAFGSTLSYHYVLEIDLKFVSKSNLLKRQEANVAPNVCAQPDMRKMIEAGGRYNYSYTSTKGEYIGDFTISKMVCSSLNVTPAQD